MKKRSIHKKTRGPHGKRQRKIPNKSRTNILRRGIMGNNFHRLNLRVPHLKAAHNPPCYRTGHPRSSQVKSKAKAHNAPLSFVVNMVEVRFFGLLELFSRRLFVVLSLCFLPSPLASAFVHVRRVQKCVGVKPSFSSHSGMHKIMGKRRMECKVHECSPFL